MFEATLRSGEKRNGDTVLLTTLPHGEAKLATLQMREFAARAKAKAKAKANAAQQPPPTETSPGAATEPSPVDRPQPAADDKESGQEQQIQVLQATTTNRDDWLHRGRHLLDVTWDCYVQNFERVRKPRDVSRRQDASSLFPFETHYVLYDGFCQRLRDNPRVIPRLVGAACGGSL